MSELHPSTEGHRDRLRSRFLIDPVSFSAVELLELLLTYAIPRRDVAPIARHLIDHFGDLEAVFASPVSELIQVNGVGEATALFLQAVKVAGSFSNDPADPMNKYKREKSHDPQLPLFNPVYLPDQDDVSTGAPTDSAAWAEPSRPRTMRVFANDEVANSIRFLPDAARFDNLEAFKKHLISELPYNSETTRNRRVRVILDRFYPDGQIDTALTFYASRSSHPVDLKSVVFYHVLKAEPVVARLAEEFIWPALPVGRVNREHVREFVLRYLPDASASSQANMLRSIFLTYELCSVGHVNEDVLRFGLRAGTLESFLYLLTREYPEPGIYSFESLFEGPLHRWLLWHREWIRRQLYKLRDLEIVSKIAEIDTVRQFTLPLDPKTALQRYFSLSEGERKTFREGSLDEDYLNEEEQN